jgi:alanyl-tRNA synthetase
VVFAETPFYGESGGQMGDRGLISGDGFEGEVVDVQKPVADLVVAHVKPKRGSIRVGGKYEQKTDREIRALTARNHTATHLLHWALREVLGKHVKQAGSLVAHDLLRFDFSHFQAMTPDEIRRVEDMINEKIWLGDAVSKREMSKDAAVAAGAIAFFGEKYGDQVRVVSVGGYSTELCGGTHVDAASDIHLFKLGSEQGIAAGVRRIIAYTSKGAFEHLRSRSEEFEKVRDQLKANALTDVRPAIERIVEAERAARKQVEQLQAKAAAGEADELLAAAKAVGPARFVSKVVTGDGGSKRLKDLAEALKSKAGNAVIALATNDGGKAALLVACGAEAQKAGFSAGEILKAAIGAVEGRGGGKADMAQGAGPKVAGLQAAIDQAYAAAAAKAGGAAKA